MSDDERRAFTNAILLCTPHHIVVDRLHPEDYPVDMLMAWKRDHERDANIDQSALASVTDERLVELIEIAVKSVGPQRRVTVELGIGVATATGVLLLPSEIAHSYFDMYGDLGPPVVVVTTRNQGALKSFVNVHAVRLCPSGASLMAPDHFPGVNPRLPYELEVGESASWMCRISVLLPIITVLRERGADVTTLEGEVVLGSGETVTCDQLQIELQIPTSVRDKVPIFWSPMVAIGYYWR
jgi:hypothetical protein